MSASTKRARFTVKTIARATAVAWLTFVALILVIANEVAIPLDYLVRPMLVMGLPALIIGSACLAFGRFSTLVIIVACPLILIPSLWPLAVGVAVLDIGLAFIRRKSGAFPVGRFAFMTVIILIGVSAIRLVPLLGDYFPPRAEAAAVPSDTPVYLFLLDGYPRIDSLAELGIDNTDFIDQLEARGFDHYPAATSAHQWTHRTLQAMIAGSPAGIPDEPGSNVDEQRIRAELQLPDHFVAIDPPTSHITMRGGNQVSAGGPNDFEIRLVGTSIIGAFASEWASTMLGSGLRAHFERSLELVTDSRSPNVFAHLMAPHPPFIYADGIADCWPGCDIFDVRADKLGISIQEWGEQMATQLPAVNERILATVDELVAAHPDAVIVLFSDHGGRYGEEGGDESHQSFLVARTPGHPRLFDDEPHPHAVLRLTLEAYP